jgi:hypothetical protein
MHHLERDGQGEENQGDLPITDAGVVDFERLRMNVNVRMNRAGGEESPRSRFGSALKYDVNALELDT